MYSFEQDKHDSLHQWHVLIPGFVQDSQCHAHWRNAPRHHVTSPFTVSCCENNAQEHRSMGWKFSKKRVPRELFNFCLLLQMTSPSSRTTLATSHTIIPDSTGFFSTVVRPCTSSAQITWKTIEALKSWATSSCPMMLLSSSGWESPSRYLTGFFGVLAGRRSSLSSSSESDSS